MNEKQLTEQLNAKTKEERLEALRGLRAMLDAGEIEKPVRTEDTNNHVHTTFSFSSYSPTAAVYKAYMSGLATVGIVDHDTVDGAHEFIEAGDIIGITTTIGAEVRVSFAGTPLEDKKINNPDEVGNAYITLHGIPHSKIEELDALLMRVREARNERNRKQVDNLNRILLEHQIYIDFDEDVVPVSMAAEGGSITERHILFALAKKLIEKYGRGQALVDFLQNNMGIGISPKTKEMLLDTEFYAYEYDVLNVLKANLVPRFYVPGGADIPPVKEVVDYARQLGVIPTYCYLGDVDDSPTGDKKAQKFEDGYLTTLMVLLRELGFEAVSYMPARNTEEQLKCIMNMCKHYGFMEISGEDVNQPRQSFVCEKLRDPEFAHLADSTWALVGHEHATEENIAYSIYSKKAKHEHPDMESRIAYYRDLGLKYRK
ncbi:PHP domain-containing protein [Christensenellaceae bacterium OttesenSCG-928-K19]|nr:PHP domain-containing protein [Christensenellaceae bacterium OttesenSCG-928-K19]